MREPLAHSAIPERKIPGQLYRTHTANVIDLAQQFAAEASRYLISGSDTFRGSVRSAAAYHDLGKLAPENQEVLRQDKSGGRLPLNHVDAGVAHLLSQDNLEVQTVMAAALVFAHHKGLPALMDECNRGPNAFRVEETELTDSSIRRRVNQILPKLLEIHQSVMGQDACRNEPPRSQWTHLPPALDFRLALSCLVDADHTDTARHYRQLGDRWPPHLHPLERLNMLRSYVKLLSADKGDARTQLRKLVFDACLSAEPTSSLYACGSPVGTGKTTAVMSYLLHTAAANNLRRIFVVLPFTNIIDQSVKVYRSAICREDEDAETVVAAHHHKAEFEDLDSRYLTYLWHAPVVVTTAVQFFETLASNHPAALRKLHQLPGSAVFLDESHAALPAHLWPQSWKWIRELCDSWGCYFVFGSGSLNRFWKLEEFADPPLEIPDLVPEEIALTTSEYEETRVVFHTREEPVGVEDLLGWTTALPGPRILIVNTVQSAAIIAEAFCTRHQRKSVEHLSTALSPSDRRNTLEDITKRLRNPLDSDWTLVATSCAEAGLDFSFRTGMRERRSLNNLIQVGGRVNRNGEYGYGEVWDFILRYEGGLVAHPDFEIPAKKLGELFREELVGPEWCTEAMKREIRDSGLKSVSDHIHRAEAAHDFRSVNDLFRVIHSETVTAIVNSELVAAIEAGKRVSAQDIQQNSVQIWCHRSVEFALRKLYKSSDLFAWTLTYDSFLGYMAGVIEMLKARSAPVII